MEQGAGGEGSSSQRARLLSKHADRDGCPSSSAWPGQAWRHVYGLSPLLEEGTPSPTQVALSGAWVTPGRRKVRSLGGGKFGTLECRDSTNSHGEGLAAGEMGEHHGAARGDKWVKAVFWLCIFCVGSAVSLHRGPCCMEEAQPELCLLEPTEELALAREGGCKQRGPGWWEGSGAGGGSGGPAPHHRGACVSCPRQAKSPGGAMGTLPCLLEGRRRELELGGARMVQDWGVPGRMQWASRACLAHACWDKPISARQPWTGLSKRRRLPFAGLGLSQWR